MKYSRLGLYAERKKKVRIDTKEKKRIDWINVGLFLLLLIVILMFVFFK